MLVALTSDPIPVLTTRARSMWKLDLRRPRPTTLKPRTHTALTPLITMRAASTQVTDRVRAGSRATRARSLIARWRPGPSCLVPARTATSLVPIRTRPATRAVLARRSASSSAARARAASSPATCNSGKDCNSNCSTDALCDIHCSDAEKCKVSCATGSTCAIDCSTSDCTKADCEDGASCPLECRAGSTCDFGTCSASLMCPGNIAVCNRLCP